jgi:hypothetical protein
MGKQKTLPVPEPDSEPVVTPAVEPAGRAEQSLLGVRLGNTLASTGTPPPDVGILGGSGLAHPTGVSHRAALARNLQRRRGNAFVQGAVLQYKAARATTDVSDEAVSRALADRSPGRPLIPAMRRDLESRFDHNLADVRVHTDGQAAKLAQDLNAHAFTRGRNIYFGTGKFKPETAGGAELLSHELAHVVQGGRSVVSDSDQVLSSPGDLAEHEAHRIGTQIGRGGASARVPIYAQFGAQIHRQTTEGTEAGIPSGSAGQQRRPGASPILWGLNTRTRRLYASVLSPGHTLVEIVTHIYQNPGEILERVRQANSGLPDFVPAGRNIHLVDGARTEHANQEVNRALEQGTIIRTEGMEAGGQEEQMFYRFSAAGQTFELTKGQLDGMLKGLSVYLTRKANYVKGLAEGDQSTHQDYLDNTNSWIRGISNWAGGTTDLPVFMWDSAIRTAERVKTYLREGELTTHRVASAARILKVAAEAYADAKMEWRRYIGATISGAESVKTGLEITRDTAFMVAAACAGAAVVPAVVGAGGVTLASGTAAVAAGTGVGAATGATLEFTSAAGGEALSIAVTPGEQSFDWSYVGERTQAGAERGALSGGLGAAGALVAPGVSGFYSSRLFGTSPQALTGFGARATVNVLTGATIGTGAGALDSAIVNVPALARGEITAAQYLSRIGWNALVGGAFGAGIGFVQTVFTRPPTTALARPAPQPGGRPGTPQWEYGAPQVKSTGEVTQFVRYSPGNRIPLGNIQPGEVFRVQFRPGASNATITRINTGEVAYIRAGQVQLAGPSVTAATTPVSGPLMLPGGQVLGPATPVVVAGAVAPTLLPPGQTQGLAIMESAGATKPTTRFYDDPFTGERLPISATAQTSRSLWTGIRADIGEVAAYNEALARGEIGLQKPFGANVSGADFITAVPDGQGGITEIIVTDAKTSGVGRFPTPETQLKSTWVDEVEAAIAPDRLDLGDPNLEAAVRAAYQQGQVRLRQLNVDYSPNGQATITGWP